MPDPTQASSGPQFVELRYQAGTLFAVPNAGHVRVADDQSVTWSADFPFTVEFTALTSSSPALKDRPADTLEGQYSLTLDLAAVPPNTVPPAYKYTVKGGGTAAGKVLDPIIIVDKK